MTAIEDHPLRYQLANELHARPFPSLDVPCTGVYLAVKRSDNAVGRNRQDDVDHLINLLDRHGAPHPQPGATHYFGQIGRHMLKWEQHTEFVTYTAFSPNLSTRPFDPADFEVFPEDWLANAPGVRVTSGLLRVEPFIDKADTAQKVKQWFVPESLAVAKVLDAAAVVAGDFRIDDAGHFRFAAFVAADTGPRRVGRVVQRLCEIETYKAMSMLGFARARRMSARMGEIDAQLSGLTEAMASDSRAAEDTLSGLLRASAELENIGAKSSFRFGATRAYEGIVHDRIRVLREERFNGQQTFAEFMLRRFDPAMRTVKATEGRLSAMSDRAMRAGELLRTRVDVERSAQNQKLLESMDRRADLALRLQETVEGLSVVAISYYGVSLAAYLLYPLAGPFGLSKGQMTAGLVPIVMLLVWFLVRRIKQKIH